MARITQNLAERVGQSRFDMDDAFWNLSPVSKSIIITFEAVNNEICGFVCLSAKTRPVLSFTTKASYLSWRFKLCILYVRSKICFNTCACGFWGFRSGVAEDSDLLWLTLSHGAIGYRRILPGLNCFLKMKTVPFFETVGSNYPVTQCHIPEERNPQLCECLGISWTYCCHY